MSNQLQQVTYDEFIWLLTKTQKHHIDYGEPIPAITQKGKDTIEYCLQAPFMGVYDEEFYKTFDDKAAILFYDICKLHGLINGNKRMAIETTLLFAYKNNRYCFIDKSVLKDIAKRIVTSNPDDKDEMVWWVSRVFYGGLRKTTFFMKVTFILKVMPRLLWYLIRRIFSKNVSI